ncbi:uncharacterized protein TrAFT101_007561 [Trichoderma asperellum]|uniref:uncharacterized protein n=1 Tax=Trichoderma asperellum TaxID=101201 RepID=UPI00331BAD6F|nr:hypothetical protein TrAFT101_007561 [Trichoderma asperellum]
MNAKEAPNQKLHRIQLRLFTLRYIYLSFSPSIEDGRAVSTCSFVVLETLAYIASGAVLFTPPHCLRLVRQLITSCPAWLLPQHPPTLQLPQGSTIEVTLKREWVATAILKIYS